eukprot:GHRR01035307.1.p1 GENE.GHRR01035307.1~~GHRR01035307.1.p1  ORF type:complete len:119 (+),score=24.86 GHRR01035307.1:77-433(+)
MHQPGLSHGSESVVNLACCRGISVTICCPGPVATGTRDAPRMIYGPTGPIQRIQKNDSKRMDTERAAYLIAKAMAAGVPECWLARQPVLTMGKLMPLADCCIGCESEINHPMPANRKS